MRQRSSSVHTASVSRLDVGVTFDLAGQVSLQSGPGYFDRLTVRGFAQVRIWRNPPVAAQGQL